MSERNDGPDRRELPEEPEAQGAETRGADDVQDGPGMDEEGLRRLLHEVVQDVEPAPESLERLRRAVPARRARRRQALVGAAAAVLFAGTAVPALVHVTHGGGAADHSAKAGHSQDARNTAEGGAKSGSDGGKADRSSGPSGEKGKRDKERPKERRSGKPGTDDTGGGAAGPSSGTMAVTSPGCVRDQLGGGGASASAAAADGAVYGGFRVVNVSGSDCTVRGAGSVVASAQGAADAARVSVVAHTAGDAAGGLPDPSAQQPEVILKPGQAYEVKFAWIPSDGSGGCAATGTPPDPDGGSGTTEGGEPQTQDGEPPGEDTPDPQPTGSVLISHTPQAGEPAAGSTTIENACAGTLYHTGLLTSS